MTGPMNKLRITPEDIAQSPPRSATAAQSATEGVRIVIRDVEPIKKPSRWSLLMVTLVPFANAVVWYRRGCQQQSPQLRQRCNLIASTCGVLSILPCALIALLLWSRSPRTNWTEVVAANAGESVVLIRTETGLGTGFVIASRNNRHLILTNRHVLAAVGSDGMASGQVESRCRVLLRNGQEVVGRLVGVPHDPKLDLVLLETSVAGLRPMGGIAPFSDIRVGQQVVAVGHPHGFDFTVTDGIVSAKRDGLMVQTSAAINSGNSGGPLIDERLRVIGVNTLTVRHDVAHGLGFAIRADIATDATAWDLSDDTAELMPPSKR